MKHSLTQKELSEFLHEKVDLYNCEAFIESDPIQIPKQFEDPNDIEIAGFLAATIAWGQRKTIIANMNKLLDWMGNTPYDFILNAADDDLDVFRNFKHRTFNGEDCIYFLQSLQNIYRYYGGLGRVFREFYKQNLNIPQSLIEFRKLFFELPHSRRTQKHVADLSKGSAAKRLNMFLRWMVRNDSRGVDLGLWNQIDSKDLFIPLDIHSGTIARKLGLLKRKQNDWQAVEELTAALRKFDPDDPVKFDFALFGLGVFEKF